MAYNQLLATHKCWHKHYCCWRVWYHRWEKKAVEDLKEASENCCQEIW